MAVFLRKTVAGGVELSFSENEEEFILPHMRSIRKTDNSYYAPATLWDCAGDVAFTVCVDRAFKNKREISDKRIVLYAPDGKIEKARFYKPETLLKLFSSLNDWQVTVKKSYGKEDKKMSNEAFRVECPAFEGNDWNNDYRVHHGASRRDYAHPIDSGIVRVLDNRIINTVFKTTVDMLADFSQGNIVASGVVVGEENYPEINKIVEECVAELGIRRPYVIVSSSISGINAVTFGSDEEPYIALSPLLIKTMGRNQLKFVIGHECGHIAMGHVVYHSVINLATIFAGTIPVIAPIVKAVGAVPLMAWSRRSEITADRAGLLCCGDAETAKRTLLQITLPFMDADEVNVDQYVRDSSVYLKRGTLRKINELNQAHPIIPKRINAIDEFVRSEKYARLIEAPVPEGALSDRELERRIEDIVRVFN